jgi:hypothetical protein
MSEKNTFHIENIIDIALPVLKAELEAGQVIDVATIAQQSSSEYLEKSHHCLNGGYVASLQNREEIEEWLIEHLRLDIAEGRMIKLPHWRFKAINGFTFDE